MTQPPVKGFRFTDGESLLHAMDEHMNIELLGTKIEELNYLFPEGDESPWTEQQLGIMRHAITIQLSTRYPALFNDEAMYAFYKEITGNAE